MIIAEYKGWIVTSFHIDHYVRVRLVIEKGMRVEQISMTVEEAINSGLLNFDKLDKWIEKL